MTETPEEVAKALTAWEEAAWDLLCQPDAPAVWDKAFRLSLASALRAQYVAGLLRGMRAAIAFGSQEAQAISARIRELADQAKRG